MGTGIAESTVHAVVIRAGGFGNSDFTVFYGNHILTTIIGGDGDLPVDPQIHCVEQISFTGNFCENRGLAGAEQEKTGAQTEGKQKHKNKNPDPGVHGNEPPVSLS